MPKTVEGYGRNPRLDFWAHHDVTPTGCWIWRGGKNRKGQGVVRLHGRNRITSRVAWELKYGPIPEGLWVLHRCDTPACINPDHLFLGTARDNVQDMIQKGRAIHQKRPPRIAECHPERKYAGRGMCESCYNRWYYLEG